MKKLIAIAFLLFVGIISNAQDYPYEWRQYTSDGYFHDIESDTNDGGIPETQFKNNLFDIARSNLAKQIQLKVTEVSQMSKDVVNGNANIYYSSQRDFSTNVEMRFVESQSYLDVLTGKQYVIVFINKKEACDYYEREIKMLMGRIDNQIAIADNYISSGFKAKAKTELQNALKMFVESDDMFFWLNIFGLSDYQIQQYSTQIQEKERTVKSELADLEYGTSYCIICTADSFGKVYPKLKNEIKGDLSASGCNFVDDPDLADYVIHIDASAREYNKMTNAGGMAYFTFIDAAVSIDKVTTSQRIYEDEISVKGSHTLSYDEAARDGYKKIRKEISKMLKENIEL